MANYRRCAVGLKHALELQFHTAPPSSRRRAAATVDEDAGTCRGWEEHGIGQGGCGRRPSSASRGRPRNDPRRNPRWWRWPPTISRPSQMDPPQRMAVGSGDGASSLGGCARRGGAGRNVGERLCRGGWPDLAVEQRDGIEEGGRRMEDGQCDVGSVEAAVSRLQGGSGRLDPGRRPWGGMVAQRRGRCGRGWRVAAGAL